mmetsp:Transcript_2860/g.3020  ORF Transcript_2860/g.3020 Transcript_2860/m.3020 type:complete len:145 (+) Transcript_2860:66-500(+)|eukprot:CAMPEP_0182429044 /NCGR_PEP_ID=MMETSP1167-20130531/25471_1 /TAXON_ID=2988 /ORGANISM="Mallomonas Sp, Strain CCMP3275" /LENGTH=144 /DNA_ID=CAMNT_0024612343 /DNA_START=62 /DNA_END=496 /DNA_ORIENTATION=+
MADEEFVERFREHIGSEDFDEKIQRFLRRNAKRALKNSDIGEGKTHEGIKEGEFTLESHEIWEEYLALVEDHMKQFQEDEGMSDRKFKAAVEEVGEQHPMLVRLMLASWEFTQFLNVCKDYLDEQDDDDEDEDEGKSDSKSRRK